MTTQTARYVDELETRAARILPDWPHAATTLETSGGEHVPYCLTCGALSDPTPFVAVAADHAAHHSTQRTASTITALLSR